MTSPPDTSPPPPEPPDGAAAADRPVPQAAGATVAPGPVPAPAQPQDDDTVPAPSAATRPTTDAEAPGGRTDETAPAPTTDGAAAENPDSDGGRPDGAPRAGPDRDDAGAGDEGPGATAPADRAVARGRLGHAMRPRATRAQLLGGLLCALLGFALVVQARQTQTQGLDQLRQADLVRLLDNVTNAEARAEQDLRSEQAVRDRLASGTDSSAAAQQAAAARLDTLGLLAGTVPAAGPGIELEITDPRRQVDASILLDTLEELRDGGAEVVQVGEVRVVAATAFTDDADGVRADGRLLTPPFRFMVIGEPQTLAKVLQIPGGVLDVLRSKGATGRVTTPATVEVDALRPASKPQYARPAPGRAP